MNKFKILTIAIITILQLNSLLNPPNSYALQCRDANGILTSATGSCPPNQTPIAELTDLEAIFANIVSISGLLLGFSFFIMLILGGSRYLLSGGDPKAVQAAKSTITWAIIGLALFALSFTILLIIQAFTGVNVTVFKIIN